MLKIKTKNFRTMLKDNIVTRLIRNFPDAIVTDDEGYLDFEESVYNLAVCVLDNVPAAQQYYMFGESFNRYDEMYEYLYKNIPELREGLELFLTG